MEFNPHLNFNGQCEEAFKLYEKCLNGKIEFMMMNEQSPMAGKMPPELAKKIMHATLRFGNQVIMGADAPPQHYQKPQGFSVCISVKDVAEAERIFEELSTGGAVRMPLEKTFWAERFGMFTDRFGTPWMINCEAAAEGEQAA
jgi:PhnB protein